MYAMKVYMHFTVFYVLLIKYELDCVVFSVEEPEESKLLFYNIRLRDSRITSLLIH